MSFHVQKWLDIQMVGRTYQVKRRQIKKEGKKRWGEKLKKFKKRKKKIKYKEKRRSQQNKRKEREGRGGKKIERKTERNKERKKSWDQVFKQKEVLCWD